MGKNKTSNHYQLTAYEWGMGLVVPGHRKRATWTRLTDSRAALAVFDRGPKFIKEPFRTKLQRNTTKTVGLFKRKLNK